MPIRHVNRQRKSYYLHEGKTKTGKRKWHFSMKSEGTLAEAIPEGYEIYENPNAQVFLRKAVALAVTREEVESAKAVLRKVLDRKPFIVDIKPYSVIVHFAGGDLHSTLDRHADEFGFGDNARFASIVSAFISYTPMLKFELIDEATRLFAAYRWCFLGSIDDWFCIGMPGELPELVEKYAPHLGRESFFELM